MITFEAIGTLWTIDSDQSLDGSVEQKIKDRIDLFDKTYSRFREDSLITKISRAAGRYKFPDDAGPLFEFYRKMYDVSAGKVTPLIGNLLVEAGYDANYSLVPQEKLNPVPPWDEIMDYNHPMLTMYSPAILDFGAAGKGYLVDIIGELLNDEGISSYIIDAGGDMLRKTPKNDTVTIGLAHPVNNDEAIGTVELGIGSICGSAGNRRKWAGLHHIMDPVEAQPVRNIIATWAMADTAMLADGMATALFFTNPSTLQKDFTFEYCLVRSDLSCDISQNFPAEMFTSK